MPPVGAGFITSVFVNPPIGGGGAAFGISGATMKAGAGFISGVVFSSTGEGSGADTFAGVSGGGKVGNSRGGGGAVVTLIGATGGVTGGGALVTDIVAGGLVTLLAANIHHRV